MHSVRAYKMIVAVLSTLSESSTLHCSHSTLAAQRSQVFVNFLSKMNIINKQVHIDHLPLFCSNIKETGFF